MEFPSLPTDNLYKFLATFGLVLLVFSSYMFTQTPEKLYSEIDSLQVQDQLIKIKVKNDSIAKKLYDSKIVFEHVKDSLEFDSSIKRLNRKVDRLPKLLYLYSVLLVIGFIATIVGFIRWYFRTQKYSDEILKNEADKYLKDKSLVIHSLQFEKEFNVYIEIWSHLISLKEATQNLRYSYESSPPLDSVIRSFTNVFIDTYEKSLKSFEHNKPFYPEEIYNSINTILKGIRNQVIDLHETQNVDIGNSENAEKNMDVIIENIDEVCLKIRDRIGILRFK